MLPPINRFLRDRANLLHAAGVAADMLEQRATLAIGPTVTLSRDELAEIADQFARVVCLLTAAHLTEAQAAKERSAA